MELVAGLSWFWGCGDRSRRRSWEWPGGGAIRFGRMIRVLLAEDQTMVRGALASLIALEPDIEGWLRSRAAMRSRQPRSRR